MNRYLPLTKYQETSYNRRNQDRNPRINSPPSHLSNSLHFKEDIASTRSYGKGGHNTPSQYEPYPRPPPRYQDRPPYESFGGYANRSIIDDPMIKYGVFSSTGNLKSSVMKQSREDKYQSRETKEKRENSKYYSKELKSSGMERWDLEGSRLRQTNTQHLQKEKEYFSKSNNFSSSTNFSSSPFQSYSYRKETVSGMLPLRKQSMVRDFTLEEEPYFEYILRYSYRSKRGYAPSNPSKPNQDSFITVPNINDQTFLHYFGVCDGHGSQGHLVSGLIKNKLTPLLAQITNLKNPKNELLEAYKKVGEELQEDQNIDSTCSGSTAVGCYLNHNKLYCCNVGDSRAILGKKTQSGAWSAKQLTIDHKPCLEREAERIKKAGGRVQAYKGSEGQDIGPLRVWFKDRNIPGLAMTRSFGDTVASPIGVINTPEVDQYTLCSDDKIVVIASDGLWEFMSNKEVIDMLAPYYEDNKIQQACNSLLEASIAKWKEESSCLDDTTFIVLFLDYAVNKN